MTADDLMIRPATFADIPALESIIERAFRILGSRDYTPEQLSSALRHCIHLDPKLIADGTYFVAVVDGQVAGGGGWSRYRALYGGTATQTEPDAEVPLDPDREPARIRMFCVDPNFARRGIGRRLMQRCEDEARAAGFRELELLATLTGIPLYTRCGFQILEPAAVTLPDGETIRGARMTKPIATHPLPDRCGRTLVEADCAA